MAELLLEQLRKDLIRMSYLSLKIINECNPTTEATNLLLEINRLASLGLGQVTKSVAGHKGPEKPKKQKYGTKKQKVRELLSTGPITTEDLQRELGYRYPSEVRVSMKKWAGNATDPLLYEYDEEKDLFTEIDAEGD